MKRLDFLAVLLILIANPVMAADIDGRVAWSQRVDMSTPVSGMVAEVLVNAGDKVEKDAVLLRLQPDRFDAALRSANAVKKDAQYKLKEAEREWDRAQELYERTVLSDTDLQLAENLLVSAQAEFAKAKAQQINAKRDALESVVRAPFAAVVLQRHVEVGQTVVSRTQAVPLLTLAATKTYHVIGAVTSSYASKLATRQAVTMTINGKSYNGILAAIGYETLTGTDTYPVTISFSAGDDVLREGQIATIHFP